MFFINFNAKYTFVRKILIRLVFEQKCYHSFEGACISVTPWACTSMSINDESAKIAYEDFSFLHFCWVTQGTTRNVF